MTRGDRGNVSYWVAGDDVAAGAELLEGSWEHMVPTMVTAGYSTSSASLLYLKSHLCEEIPPSKDEVR